MHRVTLHPNAAVIDYTVSPLWVTDRTNVSIHPMPLKVLLTSI